MITTNDIQILNGKSVELICFAEFSVYVHLQGEILLTVEADFEHYRSDTQQRLLVAFPILKSTLTRLLQCSVVSATVAVDGLLQLTFSNGDVLNIPKQPEFESYRLRIGAKELFA